MGLLWSCDAAGDLLPPLGDWEDPCPPPVLREHGGTVVVRDDLLGVGSKARFADYLIGHSPESKGVREWVYGSSPANGYAQISLPAVCARYGKKAVLFSAQRSLENLHPYQKEAVRLGAEYHWVPSGMLNVTQARAREYVRRDPGGRHLLPMGLEHPLVLASVVKVARGLPLVPKYVWSVGSSGTLTRGLQLAFPGAEVHVVSVGHALSARERGRAVLHRSPYPFAKELPRELRPPFPSVATYDAKAWPVLQEWLRAERPKGVVLFWNVGG